MNSHEDARPVPLGGLHLQRGEKLGFVEKFLQRGCALRSGGTLYRGLIYAGLKIARPRPFLRR